MSIAKKAISGVLWMSGISYIGFAVNFGIQLALVRLLVPEDFGLFALGLSAAEILFIFFGFGFSMAAIQIRDEDDLFDTAFCLSALSGLVIVFIGGCLSLVLSSYYPFASVFVFFLLCALQLINGCSAVYSASMSKELQFKRNAIVRGVATNLSGVGAILLALVGFGVWSLAAREALSSALMFLGMRTASSYRFSGKFNKEAARRLFDFAYKRVFVRGLEIVFFRSPLFIIGTFAGPRTLGLFSQVYYLAGLPNALFSPVNQSVAFATYSRVQDDSDRLGLAFSMSSFFILRVLLPVSLLLWMYPSALLGVLYGPKWLGAAEMFKYFSAYMLVLPVFMNAIVLTLGMGRLTTTACIYAVCIFLLSAGFVSAFFSGNMWLLSLSYSLTLIAGLTAAVSSIRREGVAVPVRKIFLVPALIAIFFIAVGKYAKPFFQQGIPTFNIISFVILLYLLNLLLEYGETVKNLRYIKSRL